MPLPLGHSLAGISIVVANANKVDFKKDWKFFFFSAFLSILPDFDFGFVYIFGLDRNLYHRTFSHSILFVVCLALLLAYINLFKHTYSKKRLFCLCFLVLSSHSILDYLGADTYPPAYGIMFFFPFSTKFYSSPIPIFPSVDVSKEGICFLLDILRELGIELILLGGILLVVLRIKSR